MAAENGSYLLSSLNALQEQNNGLISNARGKGLFCAYDLPSTEERDKLIANMAAEGAIILGCGHNSIRFRPHLNISRNEIDQAMSMMKSALSKL
jgi:L-lysine 6-transaminase